MTPTLSSPTFSTGSQPCGVCTAEVPNSPGDFVIKSCVTQTEQSFTDRDEVYDECGQILQKKMKNSIPPETPKQKIIIEFALFAKCLRQWILRSFCLFIYQHCYLSTLKRSIHSYNLQLSIHSSETSTVCTGFNYPSKVDKRNLIITYCFSPAVVSMGEQLRTASKGQLAVVPNMQSRSLNLLVPNVNTFQNQGSVSSSLL